MVSLLICSRLPLLSGQTQADILRIILAQAQTPAQRVAATENLFYYFKRADLDQDSMRRYFRLAQQYAGESGDQLLLGRSKKIGGVYYMTVADYKAAMSFFSDAQRIFHHLERAPDEAFVVTNIANIYLITGNYEKCVQVALEAEPLATSCKDNRTLSFLYSVLSLANMQMDDFPKAIEYGRKAAEYGEAAGTEGLFEYSSAYRALGFAYEGAGDMENTERCHKKSVQIVRSLQQPEKLGYALLGLAEFYLDIRQLDSAYVYFAQARQIAREWNVKPLQCYMLTSFSAYYLALQQPDRALQLADSAIALARTISLPASRLAAMLHRSEALFALKNSEKAYLTLKEANSLKDSLVNEGSNSKIEELRTAFLLEQQANEYEKINEHTRFNNRLLWGGISLAAVFIALLLAFIRSKIKSAALLAEQRQIVIDQNKTLEAANQLKAQLLSIISHDLRGPLYSGEKLLSRIQDKGVFSNEISLLHRHFSDTILFTENLLFWAQLQNRHIGKTIAETRIFALADEASRIYRIGAREKGITIQNNIPPDTILWTDGRLLQIALNNLVSNAVKYAKPDTIIRLEAAYRQDGFVLEVVNALHSDIGPDIRTILDPVGSNAATRTVIGSGFGLKVCREMVEMLGGTLSLIDAVPGEISIRVQFTE